MIFSVPEPERPVYFPSWKVGLRTDLTRKYPPLRQRGPWYHLVQDVGHALGALLMGLPALLRGWAVLGQRRPSVANWEARS